MDIFNLCVITAMSDAVWAELPEEKKADAARAEETYWRTIGVLAAKIQRQYHTLSESVAEAVVMAESPAEQCAMLSSSVPELVALLDTDAARSAMIRCSRDLAEQARKLYRHAEREEARWKCRADGERHYVGEAGMY